MKKVFLTLALAAFAFAANAQFVVSGNLAFSHSGEKNIRNDDAVYTAGPQKTTAFELALRGGYALNEKLTVGIDLGFGINNVKTETAGTTATEVNTTVITKAPSFTFDVFARYNAFQLGKFNVFAEASIGFGSMQWGKTHTDVNTPSATSDVVTGKITSLTFAVVPGLNYAFNEHWSMDIYLNFMNLGFQHNKTSWAKADATTGLTTDEYDDKNYDVDNAFGLILNNGQLSGNGILNNIRFGINYAF